MVSATATKEGVELSFKEVDISLVQGPVLSLSDLRITINPIQAIQFIHTIQSALFDYHIMTGKKIDEGRDPGDAHGSDHP
jgi:hypothetical protein